MSQAVTAGFRTWRFRDELHPLQSTKDGDVHVLMPLRREAVPPEVAERKEQSSETKTEPESQPKEGKVIPMPNPNEQKETEKQPDLLELAQTARDQAKELSRTLTELVRQVKVENRAGRQLLTELQNARGVLEKLRNIAA